MLTKQAIENQGILLTLVRILISIIFTKFNFMYLPFALNTKIEMYYQGKTVDKDLFDANPHLLKLYPSQQKIMDIIRDIKSKKEDNVHYKIILHENKEPIINQIFNS